MFKISNIDKFCSITLIVSMVFGTTGIGFKSIKSFASSGEPKEETLGFSVNEYNDEEDDENNLVELDGEKLNEDHEDENGIEYRLGKYTKIKNGEYVNVYEAIVVGCNDKNIEELNIPSAVQYGQRYEVKEIGRQSFKNFTNLKSVKLPDGLKDIGNSAFSGCSSLTSINLPNGLKYIGWSAFSGCSSLTSVKLPDGLEDIDNSVFSGCSSLTSINLPDEIENIGDSAFSGCSSLTSVKLPDGLKYIGDSAFSGCSSLTSVKLPDGLKYIGRSAFSGCSSLTGKIVIPRSVESIGDDAFCGIGRNIPIIILSDKVKFDKIYEVKCIAGGVYSRDIRIDIPKYVVEDDECEETMYVMHEECEEDWTIFAIPLKVNTHKIGILDSNCKDQEGCIYYLDVEKGEAYLKDYDASMNIQNLKVPSMLEKDGEVYYVTAIGSKAMKGCKSLESLQIPRTVTRICEEAFSECINLREVQISKELHEFDNYKGTKNIDRAAFKGCKELKSFKISYGSEGVKIGSEVFVDCPNFKIFKIYDGYSVADDAFSGDKIDDYSDSDSDDYSE